MKKNIANLLIGIVTLITAVGCGKNQTPAEKLESTVGVYEATNPTMIAAENPYFVVTPDKSLYTLRKWGFGANAKFARNYQGDVTQVRYSANGTTFSSGNIEGKKVGAVDKLPEPIQILKDVVEKGQTLRQLLRSKELDLEVRLELSDVSFTRPQAAALDLLIAQVDSLVDLMKKRSLTAFWICDFASQDLYERDGKFKMSTTVTDPAAAVKTAFR